MSRPPNHLEFSNESSLREWIEYYESLITRDTKLREEIEEKGIQPGLKKEWLENLEKAIDSNKGFVRLLKKQLERIGPK